jgi:hypothetical protein
MYLVLGHLPALFAVPAALGDITTGIAAPFVARRLARGAGPRVAVWFNAFGITDLVVSAILGALTGYHLIKVTPAADLSQLPIALVPTAVVPMLLALHVISLRALAGAANTAQPPSPQLAPPSSGTADRHALRHRIQDRQSTSHGNLRREWG